MSRPQLFAFAIQNYWNRREWQSFQNVVSRAESLEFLVRVTYYIYKVWKVIEANKKRWISAWLIGIFDSGYSFEFADKLIAELQVTYVQMKKNVSNFLIPLKILTNDFSVRQSSSDVQIICYL